MRSGRQPEAALLRSWYDGVLLRRFGFGRGKNRTRVTRNAIRCENCTRKQLDVLDASGKIRFQLAKAARSTCATFSAFLASEREASGIE